MFRVWGRTFKSNKMLQSTTVELDMDDTRTHKIFKALEMICEEFDLSNPIWLETNIKEFKRIGRTRFYSCLLYTSFLKHLISYIAFPPF